MTSEETIRDIYRATRSIRATAKETGHSWQTVRRVLLQYGDYASDLAGQIAELTERGMAPDTIAAVLKIGKNAVISYLPYARAPLHQPGENEERPADRRLAEIEKSR